MPRAGKDNRGGVRRGTPGRAYANRTDLNADRGPLPVATATGQEYGKAGAQADAQRAVPMAAPEIPPLPPFGRESERPDEPVTAGLPVGPGPGPEALGIPGGQDDTALLLRALYQRFPNAELAELIEEADL